MQFLVIVSLLNLTTAGAMATVPTVHLITDIATADGIMVMTIHEDASSAATKVAADYNIITFEPPIAEVLFVTMNELI